MPRTVRASRLTRLARLRVGTDVKEVVRWLMLVVGVPGLILWSSLWFEFVSNLRALVLLWDSRLATLVTPPWTGRGLMFTDLPQVARPVCC